MQNLTVLFFLSFAMLVNAADLYVYPGAVSPDYSSIANAVDSASDGDRILVSNGSYFGDITIDGKSISIFPIKT